MRVLGPTLAENLSADLAREVPRHVLRILASREGAREAQVLREVARRLPLCVELEPVSAWVKQTLGHLIVRGDVERGPGGVYRCLPPYVVLNLPGFGDRVLRLHGDPRAERALLAALRDFGAAVESDAGAKTGATGAERGPDLGSLERHLSLALPDAESAASACESRGYPVVHVPGLAADLPSIGGLVCPRERDLESAEGVRGGAWETYDPRAAAGEDEEDRWRPLGDWGADACGLVRLRRGDEEFEDRESTAFYHGGGGRIFRLERDSASLWMLYLDRLYGHPRTTAWHNGRLWVPGIVPLKTLRWLELVSGRRVTRGGRRLGVQVDEAPGREVQAILKETLGLRALNKLPEKRRRAGGGRGGRWRR